MGGRRCEGFDGDGIVKGEIKLAEFASTNDEDEYEFEVTALRRRRGRPRRRSSRRSSAVVAAAFHAAPRTTFAKELAEM